MKKRIPDFLDLGNLILTRRQKKLFKKAILKISKGNPSEL